MVIPEEYKKTVKSALNMLSYSENTKKGLILKLRQKGYSPESVEFAIQYVESKRLLDEKRYLYRFVELLANTKYYGEIRIKNEIARKGFDREIVEAFLQDALDQVDFDEVCQKLALKIYKGDKESTFFALVRYGHNRQRAGFFVKNLEK